ncbi:holin [Mycolicibacterium goodii]|uniref:holin n=1 Tax=Mycolicibacterium goodii TaxID=134601 RepID=UPI001BDC5A99|nr:holin [Mycolicibacterium goodii]MBU8821060.1 holin [Mycolicibacterium goodii]
MWTLKFWKDATERAVKSAAQAAILALGGEAFNAWTVDWPTVGGIALGGAALSLLTSLGSDLLPFGTKGTASLAKLDQDDAR